LRASVSDSAGSIKAAERGMNCCQHSKFRPGEWVPIPPVEHHPSFADPVSRPALQPP
jgi:hypothetical protein